MIKKLPIIIEVAETLFQNQKYNWCIFIEHLEVKIEKIRKYMVKVSSLLEVIPCSLEDYQEKDPFIEEI